MVDAKWYFIDDHEIMSFLGPKGKVSLTDIPSQLMTTEVGSPGGPRPRYRPSYYFFRILETSLWGDSTVAWHVAHLGLLAVSIVLYWRFFMRWIGLLPAAFLILFLLTYMFWTDIWNRLGPAEAYCVVGTGLLLEAYYILWRHIHNPLTDSKTRWATMGLWVVLAFGAMLAMGSKENFLLMLPPMWVLAIVAVRRHRTALAAGICTALATAYGLFIAAAVSISIVQSGGDVYQRQVTVSSRLGLLWMGVEKALAPLAWWDVLSGVLLIALPLMLICNASQRRMLRRSSIKALIAIVGLLLLYASQVVFYSARQADGDIAGGYPTKMRYDVPGVPAKIVMVVAAVLFIPAVLRKQGLSPSIARGLRAGLAGGVFILAVHAGYGPVIARGGAYNLVTQAWTAALDRSVGMVKQDPHRPIVIVAHNPHRDMEPVIAVQKFMTARGVVNPLYLTLASPDAEQKGALAQRVTEELKKISEKGGNGFEPLETLPKEGKPFGIGLSGDVSPDAYIVVGRLR